MYLRAGDEIAVCNKVEGAEDLSADREFSNKIAVWMDAFLDMPMVGSMPAGDIVNKGYRHAYKSYNTGANNKNWIHNLFTSIFGFGNSGQYNKHAETCQSRYAHPQRSFFEKIANKTRAKDYLREICAHTGKSYSLFRAEKRYHSVIASLAKVYHKAASCQDENLAYADIAASADRQAISAGVIAIPGLIKTEQSQNAEWTKVIYLTEADQIAVYNKQGAMSNELAGEASNNGPCVLWAKIESIEYVGEEQVYDIEVEGTHNFIAGHWIERQVEGGRWKREAGSGKSEAGSGKKPPASNFRLPTRASSAASSPATYTQPAAPVSVLDFFKALYFCIILC